MAKKDKFNYFDAFEKQVDIASEVAEVLIEAIEGFESAEALEPLLAKAHEIENRGDEVNHHIGIPPQKRIHTRAHAALGRCAPS